MGSASGWGITEQIIRDQQRGDERQARYECLVHAVNRHSGYGIPVTVVATSIHEARQRAMAVGWSGRPEHAQVTVLSVTDIDPTDRED